MDQIVDRGLDKWHYISFKNNYEESQSSDVSFRFSVSCIQSIRIRKYATKKIRTRPSSQTQGTPNSTSFRFLIKQCIQVQGVCAGYPRSRKIIQSWHRRARSFPQRLVIVVTHASRYHDRDSSS